MEIIQHSGFISSIKYNNLTPWYTTTTNNEIIKFTDESGHKLNLNSLMIEADNVDLYIRILPTDYCLFISSYGFKNYDMEAIDSIQVMNPSGTHIRWSGMYY